MRFLKTKHRVMIFRILFVCILLVPNCLSAQDLILDNKEIYFVDTLFSIQKDNIRKLEESIPTYFVSDDFSWKDYIQPVSIEEKDLLLKKLKRGIYLVLDTLLVRDTYHVIDFNGDGHNDLIYTGRPLPGSGIDLTSLIENQQDSLVSIFKDIGVIINMNRVSEIEPMSFTMWIWPCCDLQLHKIKFFEYYQGSDKDYEKHADDLTRLGYRKNKHPNYILDKEVMYIKTTLFPDSGTYNNRGEMFKTLNDSVIVQSDPRKELRTFDDIYIPESYPYSIEITKLNRNVRGEVVDSIIHNGKRFYLVEISLVDIDSALFYLKDKERGNILGWVIADDIVFE